MILLSGKLVRDNLQKNLADSVRNFSETPKLVIIQAGHNTASDAYIAQKKKFGQAVGVEVECVLCDESISEQDLVDAVLSCNKDDSVTGIIVQLPVPAHINSRRVLNAIDYKKDVDGLGETQMGMLQSGNPGALEPATARGIISLCDFYDIDLARKHVVVVGRSNLVGKPVATLCLRRNATVTVCHSHTTQLADITRTADVLIVSCGRANYIGREHVRVGQVVIDVGMSRTENGLCGDVDMTAVQDVVSAITPVPGGVGPLTVLSLFQNVADAYRRSHVIQ